MDIKQADLGLLLALDALLEEESVSRAARRLGLSQPAMSAQLARLRTLFGDRLLAPAGRGLAPTSLAEGLKAPLREALGSLDALVRERAAFDPATARASFRLMAPDPLVAAIVPAMIAAIAAAGPGLRLAVLPFAPRDAWAQLSSGAADAAATAAPPSPDALGRKLYQETFLMAQRRGHPRGSAAPGLDEFCGLAHALVSTEGGGFRGAVDEALAALGRQRRIVASLPSFLLVPPLLSGSDLVCVAPRRFAETLGPGFELFEPPLPVPGFSLGLYWHPRRRANPAQLWFRRLLIALAQGGDPAPH